MQFAARRAYTYLSCETGTGKSLICIELLEQWGKRAIWVTMNQCTGVVVDEFAKWSSPLRAVRLEGSKKRRQQIIKSDDWDVLVVNYEATRGLYKDIVDAGKADVIIFDESQRIKNRTSAQTKACRKIAADIKRRAQLHALMTGEKLNGHIIVMTGTPITKNILDLWSQVDILNPSDNQKDYRGHLLGFGSYTAFEKSVAIVTPHPRLGFRAKQYEFPEDRTRLVTAQMAKFSQLAMKKDCLDLPKQLFDKVRIDMLEPQDHVYRALRNDMIAAIDDVPPPADSRTVLDTFGIAPYKQTDFMDAHGIVSADMAVTLQTRLQQITSGFVKTDDDREINIASCKGDMLREMLPNLTEPIGDHKVVIWCRFTRDVENCLDVCKSLDIGAVRFDGQTSARANLITNQFQRDPNIRALVGNIQMGVGVTLTAADYCVFYSHSHNGEHRMQALDRIHRIGQTRQVTYFDYEARGTVDGRIIGGNAEKSRFAGRTLDDLKSLL